MPRIARLPKGVGGSGLLYSVNSYKCSNDKNTMYGPCLGVEAETTYEAADDWSSGYILIKVP